MNIRSVTAVLLACLTLACGSKQEAERPSASSPAQSSGKNDPAGNEWTSTVKVKDGADQRLVEIKWNERKVKVEIGGEGSPTILKGEMRDNGKRKYAIEEGAAVAEVKADSGGFKLRSAEGKLLWKVKFADDKIKISDNEENQNPYEIKAKGDDFRVEESEARLGEVKFYADRNKVKVKDGSEQEIAESNTSIRSAAYALILMPRIHPTERAIIMAELMVRGK